MEEWTIGRLIFAKCGKVGGMVRSCGDWQGAIREGLET